MNINYTSAILFTKHTNLMPYFEVKYADQIDACSKSVGFNQLKHHYSTDRDVRLILMIRLDDSGRVYCKIKCPINPLPIREEFVAASFNAVMKFLQDNGWTMQTWIPVSMLK